MALIVKDRVKETTATTGTGTITLAGASDGFQSFSVIGDGNTTYYAIVDSGASAWEVGLGTYTASGTTLSRDTVLESSNAGSLVNFGAGSKDVFVTYPAERAVYLDGAGSAVTALDVGTLGASTANITTANITAGTVTTAPTSANDLANKSYVDTVAAAGLHYHSPVRVESPTALTVTYNNGTAGVGATLTNAGTQVALVIDGITLSTSDRVLVYTQTDATQNGVYTVTDVGSGSTNWVLTRATDADTYAPSSPDSLGQGDAFYVTEGDTGAGELYVCNTEGTITFGTTDITFTQISSAQIYSAGTGLTLAGTEFSITNTGTAGTYGSASAVPVLTTNAQGQVTSVTNTTIAINGTAVTGNIAGQAGSVANSLTAGTYLTGSAYNGSAPYTWTVDATSANTASKVVARDASGNFSAGTITAALSGNATTATTATNVAGGAANQIVYNSATGTSTFAAAPTASNQALTWNGAAFAWADGTISGVPLGSNLGTLTLGTSGTGLSGSATYNGSSGATFTVTSNATSANTVSTVVARDGSGNFSAGTITAALNGNASTATSATTATNVAGGAANQLVYNSASSTSAFAAAPTVSDTYLNWTGSAFAWSAVNGGISYITTSTTYTAANNDGVLTDTSGGDFTVTLPASPATGNQVFIADAAGSWGTNNLTVGRNGQTIDGAAEDLVCDISNVSVQFVYSGSTWEVYSQVAGTGGVLTNQELINTTITDYIESVVAIGTVTTSHTFDLANGTLQTATLTASTACTFTMPTPTAGKSFIVMLKQAATTGAGTASFTGVKWNISGAPAITSTAGTMDILTFVSDGTNWYGSYSQGYTP